MLRERLHTLACMILVLVVFTGCRGAGAFLKVAAVVAYVGVRAAVAAAASSKHSSSESSSTTQTETEACSCTPVNHGSTWCERVEGENQCMLQCDQGYVYRDGWCVPGTSAVPVAN